MSKFCMYNAAGYRYLTDRNGEKMPYKFERTDNFRGCVQHGTDMYGSIMKQNPELLKCDRVDFTTWGV